MMLRISGGAAKEPMQVATKAKKKVSVFIVGIFCDEIKLRDLMPGFN